MSTGTTGKDSRLWKGGNGIGDREKVGATEGQREGEAIYLHKYFGRSPRVISQVKEQPEISLQKPFQKDV